jgi:hypothetical protein
VGAARVVSAARYLCGVGGFLRHPLSEDECRRRIRAQLESRDESFLEIVERAIYGQPASPYLRLLAHEGIAFGDIAGLVCSHGVDEALARLYGAGIRVSLDQFKGREPLVRAGLELELRAEDFDNPALGRALEVRTSGSSGARQRLLIDLDFLSYNACYHSPSLSPPPAHGPVAHWFPALPGVAGIRSVLGNAKVGVAVERWFSQTKPARGGSFGHGAMIAATVAAGRLAKNRVPWPEYTPPDRAARVASWLCEKRSRGGPARLHATPSSAVRVCRAAREAGLEIAGTEFRLGGEPFTDGKAEVIAQSGCEAASSYYTGELSRVGISCGERIAVDEVHLTTDKVAVLQRPKQVAPGQIVGELVFTTLLPSGPKVMLNVESGDHAILEERDCGCPATQLGLTTHAHTIRSAQKLSTEGMHLMRSDLCTLIDEVLPARFGGYPTDYQFVEEEEVDGLTRVNVLISPSVGRIDDHEVVDAVLGHLSHGRPEQMMTNLWRSAQTVRVVRREPYMTADNKTLPIRTLSSQ